MNMSRTGNDRDSRHRRHLMPFSIAVSALILNQTYRQRLYFGRTQIEQGAEEIIPVADEGEDRQGRQRRFGTVG